MDTKPLKELLYGKQEAFTKNTPPCKKHKEYIKDCASCWHSLSWSEQDRLNDIAFKENSDIRAKGICIHDLNLPLMKTTCMLKEVEKLREDKIPLIVGHDVVCQICDKVIKEIRDEK